jgi:hypothetical protein
MSKPIDMWLIEPYPSEWPRADGIQPGKFPLLSGKTLRWAQFRASNPAGKSDPQERKRYRED